MAVEHPAKIDATIDPAGKVYDLAIVALRAGDCREAISHLDEALGVTPGDPDTTKLREFAVRYADVPKDRTFLDQVEALAFKPMPSL